MDVRGQCHCGQITYEATVDPGLVRICHCTDCQMFSGTGYRVSVPAMKDAFSLRSGMPRSYVKTADSGARRVHAFCGECGTPVYSCPADEEPSFYALRVGCLDRRHELPPMQRIWCRSQLEWSLDLRGVPGQE
jgi:hypothetical protein